MIRPSDQFSAFDGPATYRIMVDGLVARGLSERLQGMKVTQINESGVTRSVLHGELEDQAALAGVLSTLYDLHFALLAVEKIA